MPPQAEEGDSTWSFNKKWAKGANGSGLVRTSTSWSFKEIIELEYSSWQLDQEQNGSQPQYV